MMVTSGLPPAASFRGIPSRFSRAGGSGRGSPQKREHRSAMRENVVWAAA